ncbi:MAG: hypothetical protein ABR567_11535 [Myxococcales bacterium]|nr:hypothetical protein [Myxococcales bacterium]
MNRTKFIEHAGRRIVYMDFSGVDDVEEGLRIIEQARLFVAVQPKRKELLTLVNVEHSRFDDRIVQALKNLAKHDQPWVMAGAVVGMSALQRVIYRVINAFSGRRLAAFETVEEAKAWLVKQTTPVPEVTRPPAG